MTSEVATEEQIVEYESQLAGINELLKASPDDTSLLELKRDMEELLELSKASLEGQQPQQQEEESNTCSLGKSGVAAASSSGSELLDDLMLPGTPPPDSAAHTADPGIDSSYTDSIVVEAIRNGASVAAAAPPDDTISDKKKSKKKEHFQDFTLPSYLVPNEADSEAERNKKRRAAKALKNKWRERKKEVESTNKQKSWQSFQKKTKRKGGDDSGSIFATKDGVSDRVGVVSKKQMTEFGSRKRHKHP
jgi:survival of motor neuron-related-splicing factor 30